MKHILITGSTDGVGKLSARMMAKEGHCIYIHGRSAEKVEATIAELKEESHNPNISGFIADFSDLDAVRAMGNEIIDKLDKLDVLINNAGVFTAPNANTKQGYDLRFGVNYLAPYLLTKLILPLLEKSDAARIINLSSAAQAPISYPEMLAELSTNVNSAYAQSKLALTMWSVHLAQNHKHITTIAVNPGSLLNTKMANAAYGQHWSPAEKGAQILFELSLSDAHRDQSGQYYDNDNAHYSKAHPNTYNEVKINELIAKTEQLIQ